MNDKPRKPVTLEGLGLTPGRGLNPEERANQPESSQEVQHGRSADTLAYFLLIKHLYFELARIHGQEWLEQKTKDIQRHLHEQTDHIDPALAIHPRVKEMASATIDHVLSGIAIRKPR